MPASPKDIAAAGKKVEASTKAWESVRRELDKAHNVLAKLPSLMKGGDPVKMMKANEEMLKVSAKLHKLEKNLNVARNKMDADMRKLKKLLDEK